ncbi:Tautomerase/MIF [Russula earlei]|uniref:Tautomerase/MIF n=1 Tax=Russula earlei TaxID=71964 RepID=A0ACC0UI65_9AGAM|nr:Tautomerase/MIF [Russula earlei]
MPTLILETNVKVADPKSFVLNLSKVGASILGKPEKFMLVSYRHNEYVSFSGTFDPAFLLDITSLDNITPEQNEAYSKGLFEFLLVELGVPGNRGYIKFNDPGRAYLSYQGTTFAQIFGK